MRHQTAQPMRHGNHVSVQRGHIRPKNSVLHVGLQITSHVQINSTTTLAVLCDRHRPRLVIVFLVIGQSKIGEC
jgi:hypothetical protein